MTTDEPPELDTTATTTVIRDLIVPDVAIEQVIVADVGEVLLLTNDNEKQNAIEQTTTTTTITAATTNPDVTSTTLPPTSTNKPKKSIKFDTVTVYHFTRSQGFTSIPSQGGSTLGMKRRHFLRRKLSVDLFEEVRRRSRREILLKIRFDKERSSSRVRATRNEDCEQLHCNSISSSNSSASKSTSSSSDSDDESYSDYSDISDSELEIDSYIFCQPIGVKLRRSLLRASGVCRIDPKEKKECKIIRESRDRSGCKCVNQCIPNLCECSLLGVNCHVDRVSFPCGCISGGCQNPQGRTEFDIKRVKGHLFETLFKVGVG